MKTLYLATHNLGKVREFESLLSPIRCLPGPSDWPAPAETGRTYQENAEIKARSLFARVRQPVLSDDSGLEIDALNGEPGIHSARFGGENLKWPERWEFVQRQISQSPEKKRTARFRCVLCYFDGATSQFFDAVADGLILEKTHGSLGFGYDPIFFSTELGKSFAEATPTEKDMASHRGKATSLFLHWITRKPA